MKTVVSKHRKSELKIGVHLVKIQDISYLRDASNNMQKIDGHLAIVIQYKGKLGLHDQLYICDNSYRHKYFLEVIKTIGLDPTSTPKKETIIGKELYIAIAEIHTVDDDKLVIEDGEPVIEYHIFKVMPVTEGHEPKIKGDPAHNNGIAGNDFVTYRNISFPHPQDVPKEEIKSIKAKEEPDFNMDETPDEMPDFDVE